MDIILLSHSDRMHKEYPSKRPLWGSDKCIVANKKFPHKTIKPQLFATAIIQGSVWSHKATLSV